MSEADRNNPLPHESPFAASNRDETKATQEATQDWWERIVTAPRPDKKERLYGWKAVASLLVSLAVAALFIYLLIVVSGAVWRIIGAVV
jgi:hypothetical protein